MVKLLGALHRQTTHQTVNTSYDRGAAISVHPVPTGPKKNNYTKGAGFEEAQGGWVRYTGGIVLSRLRLFTASMSDGSQRKCDLLLIGTTTAPEVVTSRARTSFADAGIAHARA